MYLFILSFIVGNLSVVLFSQIPNLILVASVASIFIVLSILVKYKVLICVTGLLLGIFWVMLFAGWHLNRRIDKNIEGKTISIVGTISSMPVSYQNSISFNFKTIYFNNHKRKLNLKLNWYKIKTSLHVGEKWRLSVRLKRPHGFMNPGGFDYEAWLFVKDISATGYIVNRQNNELITVSKYSYLVTKLRQDIQENVTNHFSNDSLVGFLPALLVGSRQFITQPQWQILRLTGTNHLIAIAGLHIGLVAGFIFFLVNFLWRLSYKLTLLIPAKQVAANFSVLGALFYSLLAGFPIQTQRAMIMLFVLLAVVFFKRHILPWQTYFYALFLVLIINPLNVLMSGFWMSFIAVAIIIYAMQGRLKSHGFWWSWGRVQLVIMVGLFPITIYIYHSTSLIGFIANIIAVPWFAFIVMPLCVLSLLTMLFSQKLAFLFLWLVLKNLDFLWKILTFLASQPFSAWHPTHLSIFALCSASIGVLLLLAPKGFYSRKLCVIFFLPLLFGHQKTPKYGEFWITMLDVGQGLSLVLQTKSHALIYDTGPSFSDNFNMGDAVIIPYLQVNNVDHINLMMISHGDNDHIGGSFALINNLDVRKILTIVPDRYINKASYCYAGQQWQWDGISFNVLWPPKGEYSKKNNSSCVLKVSNGKNSVLFTGDIEKPVELKLIKQYKTKLQSSILVAPHHGSKTSSSLPFLNVVNPSFVLYGVGYRNRFHFPNTNVMNRYKSLGVKQYESSKDGAIIFEISNAAIKAPTLYRIDHRHLWNEE